MQILFIHRRLFFETVATEFHEYLFFVFHNMFYLIFYSKRHCFSFTNQFFEYVSMKIQHVNTSLYSVLGTIALNIERKYYAYSLHQILGNDVRDSIILKKHTT